MHPTTRALLTIIALLILLGLYAYGTFLQSPVFDGSPLTLQAVLEPFFYAFIAGASFFILGKAIYGKTAQVQNTKDKNIVIAHIILIAIFAIGFGIHTAGQMITETFVNTSISYESVDDPTYQLAYFLEENVSHILMAVPLTLILALLARTETQQKPPRLTTLDTAITALMGAAFGIGGAIFHAEGGTLVMSIVLNAILLASFLRRTDMKVWQSYPFIRFWTVGTTVMIVLCIAYGFTIGWFTQPTELGFGVE
jgi:hypothetical protein